LSIVEVVSIVKPSVVHIATSERLEIGPSIEPQKIDAVGTGIILDNVGHILTNNHLVENSQTIIVTLPTGESLFAVLRAGDVQTDTAVIRISPGDIELQPARLGDSSKLVVGQPVLAIGHALAIPGGPIVTDGIVSATGVSIGASPQLTLIDMILHTAPINPGNSGGPLVNLRAEVIGINTAIIEETRGIGFAINVNDARLVADQIIEFGEVGRGYVGITPLNVSSELLVHPTRYFAAARCAKRGARDRCSRRVARPRGGHAGGRRYRTDQPDCY